MSDVVNASGWLAYWAESTAGQASVWSVQVAIKFLERGEKITKNVEREITNHSNLLHPHIVQFKEVLLTAEYLAIVMEFAQVSSSALASSITVELNKGGAS